MKCNTCNKEFNPAILDEVIFHETHTPAVACGLIGEPANDLMANLPPSPTGQYKSVNGKPVPATREDMGRAFEFALTQSTAAQSSEIERLKRERDYFKEHSARYNRYLGEKIRQIQEMEDALMQWKIWCQNDPSDEQRERAIDATVSALRHKSLTSSPQNGEKGEE